MAEAVYILCMVASAAVALLLLRGYRQTRVRFLLWGALCFVGFMLNNLLLFIDLVIVPDRDLSVWRNAVALAGLLLLVFGLVWDAE